MTICESSALASFLTDLEPKQEGSRTIRKQQRGMSGLEWDLPYQQKAFPMMKNQTAKIKKVKS